MNNIPTTNLLKRYNVNKKSRTTSLNNQNMAKTKREYILATCFLAGAGAILSLVSLGTENWVEAEGEWTLNLTGTNVVKYGLFQGSLKQISPIGATFQITMTCMLEHNICAVLCDTDTEARYKQLHDLYNNKQSNFDSKNCPRIIRSFDIDMEFMKSPIWRNSDSSEKTFLNGGVWVSTIFFLCVSSIMGLLSCGLAVWNIAYNPIEVYLSIYGLFIYNIVAFFTILIAILLWGIMFAVTIIHDAGIYYTLVGQINTNNRGVLGYSYWINLVSLFCYAADICILYLRQYLISKEPKVNVHIDDNVDSGLYLY